MKTHDCVQSVLISAQEIQQRIAELAQQISQDYRNKGLLVVGVLKGGWMYLADLVRQLSIDVEVDFVSVSSYGRGTKSSGKVNLLRDLTTDCGGRNVLIVEDIIDSGITLSHLKDLFLKRYANTVEITALLSKPSRRKIDIPVKYVGFEIPDEFVVGYGMDYAENLRGLQDVCVLKREVYE
ncbi:MAG: hypoxanthine phosphoribosyltransferase [Candidatus Fimimonas sp.]